MVEPLIEKPYNAKTDRENDTISKITWRRQL